MISVTNRHGRQFELGKLRVEFGVHGFEIWMFPGSVEARDRRQVVEAAWRVLTPYPDFDYYIQHPRPDNPSFRSDEPFSLSPDRTSEDQDVLQLTHDNSSQPTDGDELEIETSQTHTHTMSYTHTHHKLHIISYTQTP